MDLKILLERSDLSEGVKEVIRRELSEIGQIELERDEIRKSAKFFKTIFEESPIGIEIYDSAGLLVNANNACLEIFGVSDIQDVKGFKLLEDPNIPEKMKIKLINGERIRFETAFQFNKVKDLQLYETSKSGVIYLDIQITPLKSETDLLNSGTVPIQAYLVQVQDITTRKRLIDELTESEEKTKQKYQMLVENMDTGVFLQDINGIVTFVNPSLARLVGQKQSELIGKRITPYVVEGEMEKLLEETKKRWQGLSGKFETILRTVEGKLIPVIVSANPFLDDQGKFNGVLVVVTDISDQKKFQQLQDRFIATTSHELRTPLTVIKGYTDFLRLHPELTLQKKKKVLSILDRNIARLNRLISNVHDLSKISHEIFSVFPEETDLEEFILDLQEQFHLLYPNRLITVNSIYYTKKSIAIVDQDRILQILLNLLSNAVKNSPRTSIVIVTISKDQKSLAISVQDQGVGISFLKLLELFQPFSYSETEYSAVGTGLGLYIVKTIVDAHGGSIEVQTEEGVGSIFTVKI
ncbi:MAG: PAS domain S-box protein [Promethearchaeota archaeon]